MTTKQKMVSTVALFIAVLTAQNVSAYYNPSTGRFLSRDPVAEPGFQLVEGAPSTSLLWSGPVAQQSSRWINRDADFDGDEAGGMASGPAAISAELNKYGFVLNDPENRVDLLGLISFNGCSEQQKMQITSAWNEACETVNSSRFKCCVGHFNIAQRLAGMCANASGITIKCQPAGKGHCKGACAYSYPGGSTIHLCGDALNNPNCISPWCIMLHELTHMIGHGFEKWPVRVQNCAGCSRPF